MSSLMRNRGLLALSIRMALLGQSPFELFQLECGPASSLALLRFVGLFHGTALMQGEYMVSIIQAFSLLYIFTEEANEQAHLS